MNRENIIRFHPVRVFSKSGTAGGVIAHPLPSLKNPLMSEFHTHRHAIGPRRRLHAVVAEIRSAQLLEVK